MACFLLAVIVCLTRIDQEVGAVMRTSTSRMLKFHRQCSQSSKTPKNYFFADTNVILGYRLDQYPGIREFVTSPHHQFFYTDTVLQELRVKQQRVPEADPSFNPDPYFRYVNSGIRDYRKSKAIIFLRESWQKRFAGVRKGDQSGFGFSEKQLERFEKDLLIIMEAGYACHAPGVLPDDDLRTPSLLTNNMRLMKKFILRPEARQALDDAIDTLGLERLIPVEFLEEAMDDWEQSLLRRDDVDFEVSPSN